MREEEYYNNYGDMDKESLTKKTLIDNPLQQKRYQKIVDKIPSTVNSLLDVGAGKGIFLEYLKKQRSRLRAIGLERSTEAIKIADSLYSLKMIQSDIKRIPFKQNSFDILTALEVLEHLPYETYETSLSEMQRVAKEWILVSVPYKEDRLFMRCPYCNCTFNPTYHLRTFEEEKLSTLFSDFTLIEAERQGLEYIPWGYNFLRKTYIKLFEKNFPDTSICPACGYRKKQMDDRIQEKRTKTQKLIQSPYFIYPKAKKHKWILALYRRKSF